MSRLLMVMFLFAADAVLFAAGPPDLLVAIRNGDHSQVQKLLGAGADVNTADGDGTTALMHSVIESDVKMMKLLIDHGANVNAKNALDSTALMYAATNLAKARLLLDAGADVKVQGQARRDADERRGHDLRIDSRFETSSEQRRRAGRPADGACGRERAISKRSSFCSVSACPRVTPPAPRSLLPYGAM